jgi:hypothetical protein
MTMFDDREKAYEAKYSMDQETSFKVTVRRDKLLGLWAAERMGLSGDNALAYARRLIEADLEPGDHDVRHRVMRDLAAAGIQVDEREMEKRMAAVLDAAREQVLAEMAAKP